MIRKSNNRNAVAALVVLMVFFAAVLAGSGGPRSSHVETSKGAGSRKTVASRDAAGERSLISASSANNEAVDAGLGPIDPYVISGGGGSSAGDGFSLEGTLREVSAANPQSGGGFTLQESSPAPTPINGRIVYVSGDISTMDADGGNKITLTNSGGVNDDNPVWSPDGTRIAFTTDFFSGGTSDVAIINADGTGITRITMGFGAEGMDAEVARGTVAELRHDLDAMEALHQQHHQSMSAEMQAKMKVMMDEMEKKCAEIKDQVAALEVNVQAEKPDSVQVTAHANALLKHFEKMSKMHHESKAVTKHAGMKM